MQLEALVKKEQSEELGASVHAGIQKAVDQVRREGFPQIAQSVQMGIVAAHVEIREQSEVDQGRLIRNEYLNVIREYETSCARLERDLKKKRLSRLEEEEVLETVKKSKRMFVQKMTLKLNEF